MNNLEGISFTEVVNKEGICYIEYRKSLLRPNYLVAWLYIVAGFLTIILFCTLTAIISIKRPSLFWLTIPGFGLMIGFFIAYLSLFIHEAGHFYLYPTKKGNDILANIFLCSWLALDIKAYRKIHWQHHQHLATPADTEHSYFNALDPAFIFETISGIYLLRLMLNKNNKKILGENLQRRSLLMLVTGALLQLLILYLFLMLSWQLAITWIAAMVVFFPFFATMRQILEHRDEMAGQQKDFYTTIRGKISRLFTNSLFSRLVGPAGFNKHMIHHWDPHLPFSALNRAEKFLLECDRTHAIIDTSQTTYIYVFKKLLSRR